MFKVCDMSVVTYEYAEKTITGTSSPQWRPEHIAPSDASPSVPVLTLNGTQVGMDDIAPEVNHLVEPTIPVHADQGEEDDGGGSLEDTTGSITSVD